MEGGAFHGLPQVPLRHIVTSRVLRFLHKDTNQNAQEHTLWMSEHPRDVYLLEHKKEVGGEGVVTEHLHASEAAEDGLKRHPCSSTSNNKRCPLL